jgi:LCP family protein required for cell wall assembly
MADTTRRRRRSSYDLTPTWLTRGRVLALCVVLTVSLVGGYGTRLVLSLAHLFGESPLSVITDFLHQGQGSGSVANRFASGQRVNIALYGYGGTGHDGAFLSDSIMVVSIQPHGDGQKPQVAQISIPRDWFVPIPVGGAQRTYYARVNEAYAIGQSAQPIASAVYSGDHGGGGLADATLQSMLGIPIDHFIGLDFTAFKAAVDSVGGVDINVEHTFTDNNYPRGECEGAHPDCTVETIHFDAGPQHMDGATALIFARSRESSNPLEGTNFARNKRQQQVLTAIRQKVLSVGGLNNLPDLLNSLGDHVITDLPLSDALALYDLVKNVDSASIEHVSIDDTNFIYECGPPYGTASCPAAYEYPYDRTFGTVQHFMQNLFVPAATLAEHAPVTVLDSSGRGQGASKRWASLLADTGLAATDGGVARPSATTRVIDASGGRGSGTAQWLARYFGVQVEVPAVSPAVSGAAAAGDGGAGGISLVLGQDEERAFNGTSAGAYAGQVGSSPSTSAPATTFSPRRVVPAPAAPRPTAPPIATPEATPTPGRSLLDPPLPTSTTPDATPTALAPAPTSRPSPTPRSRAPRRAPGSTP